MRSSSGAARTGRTGRTSSSTCRRDLLAQKLRTEGADAQDVGDGIGVPSLRQHRDGDDAPDLLAEPAGSAHRVHHLTQELALARLALGAGSTCTPLQLALELLDLRAGCVAEIPVQRVAGFDLA